MSKQSVPKSKWINFLREYGSIPNNDNMYDESIQRRLKRNKLQPITFKTEHLDELINNFQSPKPKSAILTGTAGDGKTFSCRTIWERLGGDRDKWETVVKTIDLILPSGKHLVIVKDLSELNEEKSSIINDFVCAVNSLEHSTVYLIAANDGQLMEALSSNENQHELFKIHQIIEDLLVNDERESDQLHLKLYNLSRLSASEIFSEILDSVLTHPGWSECNECPYQKESSEIVYLCPIWENRRRLIEPESLVKKRLIQLLQLAELNSQHIPIRQLLILVANILLGHPDANDQLLNCSKVSQFINSDRPKTFMASLYNNIFGENFSSNKIQKIPVFSLLRSFGIGKETTNIIDNILIFGSEHPHFKDYYNNLLNSDPYYGAYPQFRTLQKDYIELQNNLFERSQEFLDCLRLQRQRLFFIIPKKLEEFSLWDLTIFQYAEEYLLIYESAKNNKNIEQRFIYQLVKGLNRIFTGMLIDDTDQLIIASSGSHSSAKVSRVYEEAISVKRKNSESVEIKFFEKRRKIFIQVTLAKEIDELEPINLELNLIRYEYLSKVAKGVLPISFSQECYEDILAFKTRILKQIHLKRKKDRCDLPEFSESINFSLLEVKGNKSDRKDLEISI